MSIPEKTTLFLTPDVPSGPVTRLTGMETSTAALVASRIGVAPDDLGDALAATSWSPDMASAVESHAAEQDERWQLAMERQHRTILDRLTSQHADLHSHEATCPHCGQPITVTIR